VSALRFRVRAVRLPSARDSLLAAMSVIWSVAVIDQRLLGATLPGPAQLGRAVPYVMPALMLVLAVQRQERISRLEEAVAIWVTIVLTAGLLVPALAGSSRLTALAVPAVGLAALVAARHPALMMLIVVGISASFGSLHAFWNIPVEKAIGLALAGLWIASIAGLLFRGARQTRISVGPLLLCAYLLITLIQVPLAADRTVAEQGFKDGGWFMLAVLLIGYSGWPREAYDRIAKGILVVAALAGAYALLRVITGPAGAELRIFRLSQFNFVGGKLKPGGSFGNAQDMGTWMSAVVPFCFAAILVYRGRWRAIAAAACGLCTIAVLESQLRIGLVAIILGMLLVLAIFQLGRGFPGLHLGATLTAAVAGGALLVAGLAISGDSSSHSFRALLHPTSDPSFIARRYKWHQALRDLDTKPFGYGVGTASFAQQQSGKLFLTAGSTTVDNGFLKIALEQGLVIMGVFAMAMVATLLALIRTGVLERDRLSGGLALGAAGTLASFLIVMLAEDATANPRSLATWAIVGLGAAQVVSVRHQEPES
jgi:hypothetical protein